MCRKHTHFVFAIIFLFFCLGSFSGVASSGSDLSTVTIIRSNGSSLQRSAPLSSSTPTLQALSSEQANSKKSVRNSSTQKSTYGCGSSSYLGEIKVPWGTQNYWVIRTYHDGGSTPDSFGGSFPAGMTYVIDTATASDVPSFSKMDQVLVSVAEDTPLGTYRATYNTHSISTGCPSATSFDIVIVKAVPVPNEKNDGPHCGNGEIADPIFPGTGNVFDSETDYDGPELLKVVRRYNSNRGWILDAHNPILLAFLYGTAGDAFVYFPSGRIVRFATADSGNSWTVDGDEKIKLSHLSSPASNGAVWLLTTGDDGVYQFDSSLALLKYTAIGGASLHYVHQFDFETGASVLQSVSDDFGRIITFSYSNPILRNISMSFSAYPSGFTAPDGSLYSYSYDSNKNLVRVTYPDSSSRQYLYEDPRRAWVMTGVRDEKGVIYANWAYYTDGRAKSNILANGVGLYQFNYGLLGAGTVSVTDPLGTVRNLSYQDNGYGTKILTSTDKFRASCEYNVAHRVVGNNGQVVQSADFEGNTTNYGYDFSRNLVTSVQLAAGTPQSKTTTTTWHPNFRLPTETNEPGRKTVNVYESVTGNLLSKSVTDLATNKTRTWVYSNYTTQGKPRTIDGPRTDVNDVTTLTYDNMGNLSQVTNALGHITQFTNYDIHGNPLRMLDPNGVETTFTYDLRQRLTTQTTAGATTTYTYDAAGQVIKITLPTGQFLAYTYDDAHRLTDMSDNQGNKVHYTLDVAGNRTKQEIFDPQYTLRNTQTQVFDSLGQLKQVLGANGQVSAYEYDGAGNRIGETVANQFSTLRQFDALNRLVEVSGPNSGVTSYQYDALDHLTSVTDPNGLVTTYAYNAFGELLSQTSPDTGTTTFTYDAAGNQLTKTDARGIIETRTYDALNRILTKKYPNHYENVTYYYDGSNFPTPQQNAIGQITGVVNATGWTGFYYSPRGKMIGRFGTIAYSSNSIYSSSYSYNNADQLIGMVNPSGDRVSYQRNAAGLITQIDAQINGSSQTLASGIEYMPFGPWTRLTLGNGISTTRQFDQDYRISSIVSGNQLSRSMNYDGRDNITKIIDGITSTKTQDFTYDGLSRLINAQGHYGNLFYEYDASGNRTRSGNSANGTQSLYNYFPGTHRLQTITGSNPNWYTYTASGQSRDATRNIVYLNNGQTYYAQTNTNAVAGLYDDNNLRVVRWNYSVVTPMVYDREGQLILETNSQGIKLREYFYFDGQPLAMHSSDLGITAQKLHFYHNDHLGTPQAMTDLQGTKTWSADYDPFGKATITLADGVINNLRFKGQYFDVESGLYQNWHRDYDPIIGRYLQSDPIGLAGGINTYAYVGGNPVSYFDSTGLNPVAGAVGGLAVGGPPGAIVGGLLGLGTIYVGQHLGNLLANRMYNRPAGAIDAIAGARDWGKKNDVGGREAVDIFHDIKRGNRRKPGSKAGDNCSVNPETGDVYDGLGEHIGNLGEGH